MKHYWQPDIDKYIPESINVNNTTSFPISYAYAPSEGEEHSTHVSGLGKVGLEELRNKITEKLSDLLELSKSDLASDIDQLKYHIVTNPELQSLVTQYSDKVKELKLKK